MLASLAMLPDLDVIGLHAGIPYGDALGHRGFSHSLAFALLAGAGATRVCFREVPVLCTRWIGLAALCAVATASHGLLDALTGAGLGVGFFLPLDESRYFFGWRPLPTSPLSVRSFVSFQGLAILANEALYVGIPTALLAGLVHRVRGHLATRMRRDPEELLGFWLGADLESEAAVAARCALWFQPNTGFDARIRERFAELPELAREGALDGWTHSVRGTLALVIALDQLPRNLHRGEARAFAWDARAQEVAQQALARGDDRVLHPLEAVFLLLPLEHAEDAGAQTRSVASFESLLERAPAATRPHYEGFLDYARRHRAVIERFGRFPHRNETLGRRSTPEEIQYLASGGETF